MPATNTGEVKLKKDGTKSKQGEGGGRPSKYKAEYAERLVEFFHVQPYKYVEIEHYDKQGNVSWIDKKREPNLLPTMIGFCNEIGITPFTFDKWAKEHKKFSVAWRIAKEYQKNHLIQNGITGDYNSAFTIFTAKNITDMRDNTDVTISGEIAHKHSVDLSKGKEYAAFLKSRTLEQIEDKP